MNLGRLCQIILKSDKEISGYGQSAQHAIFAYHMERQNPLIALPPLRFPGLRVVLVNSAHLFLEHLQATLHWIVIHNDTNQSLKLEWLFQRACNVTHTHTHTHTHARKQKAH